MYRKHRKTARWALALALTLVINVIAAGLPQDVLAYNCGDPTGGGHCYGVHRWDGYISGSEAQLTIVNLSNTTYYNGDPGKPNFVYNGHWLVDAYDLTYCPDAPCWVEAGYFDRPDISPSYVWADKRPNSGYYFHYLDPVPSGDIGKFAWVAFWKNSGSYSVSITSNNYGYLGYSTPNNMKADAIDIGQELSGISGGYAPTGHWKYNKWRDPAGSTWYYQSRPYPTPSDYDWIYRPPYAGWTTRPSNSSTGGDWYAYCC